MSTSATIRDVAREANVSIATVSRILNGQRGFSKETEDRVRRTIERLGYHRNQSAWNLKTKSSNTIALIVPDVNEFFCGSLMQGVEDAAREEGYVIILCNAGCDAKFGESYIPILNEQRVSGVLACSIPPDSPLNVRIRDTGLPCVMVDSMSFDCGFPYVKIDDFQGLYMATKFLLDKGHRRIAMISGDIRDPIAGAPRLEGYRQALQDAGVARDPMLEVFANNFGYQNGAQAFDELVSRTRDFTGVVTCSDMVAAAVLTRAAQHNIRVPEDISVVGFDDSQIASLLNPPLTSVAQPFQKMGKAAVRLLLRMISGDTVVENSVFPVVVAERKSTRSV